MREILLTSSVLILAVLILRRAFRDRISRRAQYALWALVLVRLLVPVSLPGADFSVLSAAEPVGQAVTERLEQREIYRMPLDPSPMEAAPQVTSPAPQIEGGGSPSGEAAAPSGGEEAFSYPVIRERVVTAADLLTVLWLIGIAAMAVWFLVTNLRFWQKLRRTRAPYAVENCKYPVYLVEAGLPSPCLFGPVRPAIYLTPAAVETPERLRHVLAHETAHARHLDPLWSLLRSVCLAVYWFDPLVWIAAAVSKADGELACDEAAIQALGEGERIPYGKTLLSLIPVRTGPGSPLLSATTMTAGKRQLKDRITRIAQGQQTRAAALFLALALAAGVCAVTFTGAKGDEAVPVTEEGRPLTGDEVAYFNEEFFNGNDFNIHNQFLNPLYEKPEDIDLFALFYCGIPEGEVDLSDVPDISAGWAEVIRRDYGGTAPDCAMYALSTADMDAFLEKYTGLTVAETNGVGLESFSHLPEYDAYYWAHGDTNYRGNVTFTAGEREGGTIRLYFEDFHYGGYGTECVTLQAQEDGSYWFVSHLLSEKPAVATVYPEQEPVLTIPLTDLAPYDPALSAQQLDSLPDDISASWDAYGTTCYLCRLEDGNLHVVLEYTPPSGGTGIYWDVFTFPEDISEDRVTLSDAFGLLEHDCVVVSYRGYVDLPDSRLNDWINDYYSFDGDGNPILLARAYGDTAQIDLDGDGVDELCASSANTAQIFFQREDRLYEADVDQALENAWPEARSLGYEHWDVSRRNLTLYGQIPLSGQAFGAALRRAYFDGENLLIYQDHTTYTDHVADGIDVPDTVLSAAKDAVLSALDYWRGHTGAMGYADGQWQQVGTQAEWDDWRITELVLTDTVPAYPELGLRVYGLGYELHTTTPENIMLAGGMYMDEGGWVGGLSTLPPVLVFHTMADSGPVLLQSSIPNDVGRTSDNPMFAGCMAQVALENGLLTPSEVRPVDLYYLFYNNQGVFLNLMGAFPVEEQNTAFDALATYAAGVDEPGVNLLEESLQRLEESDYGLTEEGEMAELRLRNAWTRAKAEAERQSLLSSQTQGEGMSYTGGGLSLWVPEGWADMAVVTAEDAVWSGGSVPGFDVYERLAHTSNPDTGLVWNLRALTRAQFQAAFGDADWSEILGASSYVIGSDDTYIYLLSTPTDVQFLVEDPTSMAQYELLRNQSQTVLEDFLSRNGITPNPDCPDADGCYVSSASAESSPARPTEADIHAAILNHRVNATAWQSDYAAEAHRVLDAVKSGDTYTVYLMVWYSAYERTATGWQNGTDGQFPTAVTFTWQNGGWEVTEYREPASYATDLRTIFPDELVDMVVNDDEAWAALQEECRVKADAYFAEHPVTAEPLRTSGTSVFSAADENFSGQALTAAPDEMTYDERLAWVQAAELDTNVSFALISLGQYAESSRAIAWLGQWVGTPHVDQFVLTLRFADGTAAVLPLPSDSMMSIAPPESMAFQDGQFLYTVTFPTTETAGGQLVHLAGTYHYTVDLAAKTVSLAVTEN